MSELRDTTISIALDDHPGVMFLPLLETSGIMVKRPELLAPSPTMKIANVSRHDDLNSRMQRIGMPQVNMTKGLAAFDLYRLVAKVGYAFAAAELGIDNFIPCLLPLILYGLESLATHYIGGGSADESAAGCLHAMSISLPDETQNASLVIVRLRLFAHIAKSPVYYVVCGKLRSAMIR